MKSGLRDEVFSILGPIFGQSFITHINNAYGEYDSDEELIELTNEMLSRYFNESTANRIIHKLCKRYSVKIRLKSSSPLG